MIEIFQIFTFIIIFSSILLAPINIFQEKPYIKDLSIIERSSVNLSINLNILLLISFLNYPLQIFQPIMLIIYSSLLFFYYRKRLLFLKDFLIFLIPLLIIFFILSINISSNLYLGWDAKFFYYIKSLFFFDGKTIFDLNKFSQNIWHPYFGSYLWGFFWSISFLEAEYFGRLIYLFLFCYSFYSVSQIGKNTKINNSIFFILVLIFYEYEFFSGLQEIIIFSFLVLISKFFDRILISKNIIYLVPIILFSNLLIWIKSEGIIYFLISFIFIFFINNITYKLKFLIFLIFTILLLTKVYVFEIANFNINSQGMFYNLDYLSELNFDVIINKIIIITVWLSYYMLTNIFFPIFILLIIYEKFFTKIQQRYSEYDKLLYFYFCYILIFIFLAYISRDMEIVQSIRTTMDRLIMTASGFLIYPCGKKIFNILENKKFYK